MAHVLIIDDNPMNAETFADALSSEGHQYKASTGEEGLASSLARGRLRPL